ncbi:MAG: hypothetical protein ACYDDA_01980 [Acidiferrobacteraceae bacterium]
MRTDSAVMLAATKVRAVSCVPYVQFPQRNTLQNECLCLQRAVGDHAPAPMARYFLNRVPLTLF